METPQQAVNRSQLIGRFGALLQRLAGGQYRCHLALQDDLNDPTALVGIVVATVIFDTQINANDLLSIQPLLVEDPAYADVLVEAVIAGQMTMCQDLIASVPPEIWQAVRPLSKLPRAGHRYVEDGSAIQFCFGAALISRAINSELQAVAGSAVLQ